MANREENLKKINDELEKLTDEQLEQVAAGNRYVLIGPSPLIDDANAQENLNASGLMRKIRIYD